MKFYVIRKRYTCNDEELFDMYGYTTSLDVVRWFNINNSFEHLIITEYDLPNKLEFAKIFTREYGFCFDECDLYELKNCSNLDNTKTRPLYVNQNHDELLYSYSEEDYYSLISNISDIVEMAKFITNNGKHMVDIINSMKRVIKEYTGDIYEFHSFLDKISFLIKIIEEEGNYYGDC